MKGDVWGARHTPTPSGRLLGSPGGTGLCGSGTGLAGELASAATEVPQCRGSGGALGAGGVGASPAEARI